MGLPRGRRVHDRDGFESTGFAGRLRRGAGWWKLDAARALAHEEPRRRIVWIDDDLADRADDVVEWLEPNPPLHVVAPDLFTRLTHEHPDEIEAWL